RSRGARPADHRWVVGAGAHARGGLTARLPAAPSTRATMARSMTGLPLASDRPAERERTSARGIASFAVAISSALVVIGLAGIAVATPWYLDGALDRAGSAAILGLPATEVHAISWSTETELFFG